jgi:outer membrane lipoprotein SlyB
MKQTPIAWIIGTALLMAGCATNQGSKTYTRDQAQHAQTVQYGTVLAAADVTIEDKETGVGAVGGGVVGGILGHVAVGSSGPNTKLVGSAVGALAGLAAGSAAEKMRAKKQAVELEVKLDDGRTMVIVQEKDDQYAVGEKVRVITSSDGVMRVRR